MNVEIKKMAMKKAIGFVLLISFTTIAGPSSFAQQSEELSDETITKEIDQELTTFGQNPNSKTQSTSSVKKVTTTSKIQTTPVVMSSSAPVVVSSSSPAVSTSNKRTVVTTKTINELPVKVPVKTTTVTTTTTLPRAKSVVAQKTTIKKTPLKTTSSSVGRAQKQPVTFVEASPLTESRGDEIRRRRQDEEMRTESKIVEKLEQSRMDDERRRAEALFGDRLDAKPAPEQVLIQQETTTIDQSEKAIAQEVESAPLMLEQTTTESQTDISEFQKEPSFFDSRYVGLTAGVPTYPDYSNIKGNYNVGLKFGMGHDRFLFEMGLSMAQFVLEDSYYGYGPNAGAGQFNYVYGYSSNGQMIGTQADFEMKQYSGSLGSRYQILDGFIRPNVGGEFVYSYRQYSSLERTLEVNSFGAATVLPEGTNYGNSHALDFGVLAGVDLAVSQSFTIGADFKYLINVAHRINGENSSAGTPIEKLQHFVGGLSAVFTF